MEDITIKEVKRLAKLSALQFTEEEEKHFVNDLNDMLKIVNEMNDFVNKSNEIFIISHDMSNLREDEPKQSADREVILQNAPKQKDGYFNVPKVVD